MERNAELFRDNTRINENVLHLCWLFQTDYPITEDMIHDGPPHESNYGYAYAKRMLEVMSRAYREQYGCHFTTVIPTNVFGPHDNFNLRTGHVIPSLIHRCYLSTKGPDPFVVAGSGKPQRQFIYSKDLAHLIVWALENYDEPEPIILTGDFEMSIKAVAQGIARAMGSCSDIVWDTCRADGQYRKTASNNKLRKYLPRMEFTPFATALHETVLWFMDHYHVARKTHKHSTLSLTDSSWSHLLTPKWKRPFGAPIPRPSGAPITRPSGAPIPKSVPSTPASTPAPPAPRASTPAPRASTTAPPAPTGPFRTLSSAPVGLLNENGSYCYRNAGIHLLRNIPELFTTSKIMTGGAVADFINAINPNLNPTLSSSRPIVDDYKACADIWFPSPPGATGAAARPYGQQDPQEFIAKFLDTAPPMSLNKDIIGIQLRTTKRLQEIINSSTEEEKDLNMGINPGEYLYWLHLIEDTDYQLITWYPNDYGFTRTPKERWFTPRGDERPVVKCCRKHEIVLPATNEYIIVNTNIMTGDSTKRDLTVDPIVKVAGQWYKVISMVLHNGTSIHSGHYTNLTHHNGKWFFLDDTTVREMGLVDPQAYIEELRTRTGSRSTLQFVPYLILLKKIRN
ncbi:hypothetical protein HK102_007517 [Quaeritorhiza haematococci]|nr:hypothetical protein HK102_007517 [Quaeritorhiza haematococci]